MVAFWKLDRRLGRLRGVRLIRPDGTGLMEVTHPIPACVDGGADWILDGSKFTFGRDCASAADGTGLYMVNVDGTGLQRINLPQPGPGGSAYWGGGSLSPDGHQIVLEQEEVDTNRSTLYLVDSTGGQPQELLRDASFAGWSSDGRTLAVVQSGQVLFVSLDGHVLGSLVGTAALSVSWAEWRPAP